MPDDIPLSPLDSTGPPPPLTEVRAEFAKAVASALGEWIAMPAYQREAVGRIAPRLARALYLADLSVDAMIEEDATDGADAP